MADDGGMTRVLYLHGFASSPASRKAQLFRGRFAAAGLELEIPDLVHGEFLNLTLSSQLRVIEEIANNQSVALIGSSMGGYLAALYAARHPETAALVLMAPAFGFARRWAEQLGAARVAEWKERGTIEVQNYATDRMEPLGHTLLSDALGYEETPRVTQPAMVWQGLRDEVVPVDAVREFVRLNPHAILQEVDDGHELAASAERICAAAIGLVGASVKAL